MLTGFEHNGFNKKQALVHHNIKLPSNVFQRNPIMFRLYILITLVVCSPILFSCQEKPAPLLEMESFFRNGEKNSFRISPDGKYFSYRADYKGMTNIYVQKVGDTTAICVTRDTLRSIYTYFWKGSRIVYMQDTGGDENDQLFSVNADGTDLKALTPFPSVRTDIVDDLLEVKEKLIIKMNKRVSECFDPYLLDIETGELTLLYNNKENFEGWVTDNNGVIRLAKKKVGVNVKWSYRASENENFVDLVTVSFRDQFSPEYFDKNNRIIYALSSVGRDKVALVEYDPSKKKELRELYADSKYDLSIINYDNKKQELTSVYWQAEKERKHFFDKHWEEIQTELDRKFKGYETEIVSHDDARTLGIVWVSNERAPAKYYIFNFKTKDTKLVAEPFPWIDEKHMSPVKPISYKARDGLEISGYLTLPKGVIPKNLPVVVNPHGGPWDRDAMFFNREIQFLANRGYAVLQMDFRGSTGYGKKFWEAGFKQWGKAMQDDITDGVNWLIKEGIVDKKRIAIYGGSYGGYATLAGITFTPDLYAAAVDYVGVSNLFTFMNSIPPYWKSQLTQLHEMIGDPVKDSLLLAEVSPVLHVQNIKTPLLVVQGANDPRVKKAESDQMVEALRKRGVEVEYIVKDNEGHGFYNQNNLFDFYGTMERFLEKHLKPTK